MTLTANTITGTRGYGFYIIPLSGEPDGTNIVVGGGSAYGGSSNNVTMCSSNPAAYVSSVSNTTVTYNYFNGAGVATANLGSNVVTAPNQ